MQKLIEKNYASIVERGFIKPETSKEQFFLKLIEEVAELTNYNSEENFKEEIADVILVCLNLAKHFNIDIELALYEKVEINQLRAKLKI